PPPGQARHRRGLRGSAPARARSRGRGVASGRCLRGSRGGSRRVQREARAAVDGPLTPPALPERVTVREVGPRDGLQAERPLSVDDRIRLIDALSRTGVQKIEAVSFVSSKAVPAMAGAAEVWAGVDRFPGVAYSALVPNRRGAEAAAEAGGFASLQAFLAVSE